jgi:FkbM family methyltransferase
MADAPPLWVSLSASAIRALPFGRYRATHLLGRFAPKPFLARLPDDLGAASFYCDLRDTISREACFTGRYEPQETMLATELLGPGMTAVDVGANWGYFTLVCAHVVGRAGQVIALEPHPDLAITLRRNIQANDLPHVRVLELGAASATAVAPFISYPPDGGNLGLSRMANATEPADYFGVTVSLDELLGPLGCHTIDLVKIDVEGGEVDVLRGMAGGLASQVYKYVLLECHPRALARRGESISSCLDILGASGYSGWLIDHSRAAHRRAAMGKIRPSELLEPLEGSVPDAGDTWPHMLWAAPGTRRHL